jgi:arginyl-tRNA synthetase
MIEVKTALRAALATALQQLVAEAVEQAHGSLAAPPAAFESPKLAEHGDLAITSAMPLARLLKKKPRELAQRLVELLQADASVQRWVRSMEIAGPGFINLRLSDAARQSVVDEINRSAADFGHADANAQGQPKRVLIEFVSANPTGPLHVGHARQAALGDSLSKLFETQGWQVQREFYYNDAGVQIATLASSVQHRLLGFAPGDEGWPAEAYNGDYIADIAAAFVARAHIEADDRGVTASGDIQDLDAIRQFAVAYLRREQDLDLRAFGVRFDHYVLESGLYASGQVEATVQRLVEQGKTYEKDGALWLRTTDYGDDKDRVMRKSGAAKDTTSFTYFVPDVAYHIDKFRRGFDKVIDIQGGDHHGTVARVRAGLQASGLGVPAGFPDYILHRMVTVMRGGQEVKISKRAGSYVTLRDLIDWTSRDAVRFFLISRKADTEFVFDIDLALKANDENPVFYVQYAHARICSVLAQFEVGPGAGRDVRQGAAMQLLVAPAEQLLMRKLADYPDMLARAAAELAPHDVAFYLRELAAAFHSYYAAERFLVDDLELAGARMALLAATRQVLHNGLHIIGVSAPQAMERSPQALALAENGT